MSKKQWRAMLEGRPGAGRFVHISCEARMIPDPKDETGIRRIPYISHGVTYRRPK